MEPFLEKHTERSRCWVGCGLLMRSAAVIDPDNCWRQMGEAKLTVAAAKTWMQADG